MAVYPVSAGRAISPLKRKQNIRTTRLLSCGKSSSGIKVSQHLTGKEIGKQKSEVVIDGD